VDAHPAYGEEAAHLSGTLVEVRDQLTELRAVPPLDIPELIEESMETLLVAELALERVRQATIRRLEVAQREPYFGRVDFEQKGEGKVLPLYIGKAGVIRRSDNEPEVVDWRAPVAAMFYTTASGGSDEVTYTAPEGTITGTLWLKRNIGIKQGVLQRIVDAKVKGAPDDAEPILDEFLRYRLQESRDSRLRDIVSTIQGEQNAIIRAPLDRPLIIQGVAGSGKTTVALHRLAYLLYTFRESIAPERIVIFAPSRMFLDYISDVLPELGVDGVVQTTFADWADNELDEYVKLTDAGARYEHLFQPGSDPGEGEDSPGRFKGSLLFQQILDTAIAEYEATFVPEADVVLWPGAKLSYRTIAGWYHEHYKLYPIMARKERCIARVKKWAEDQLIPFMGGMAEKERRKLMRAAVQKYVKLWPNHTPVELYRQILGAKPAKKAGLARVGRPDIPRRVVAESVAVFQRDEVAPEDLAPLVYVKGKLRGYKEDRQLDHVVIDEAQDFSPFQLDLLRNLTRENSFTILGDLSQGIHAYAGIHRWDEFMECFAEGACGYYTLEQSYRSTLEVMSFANQVISKVGAPAALARPVFRSGEPVRVPATTLADLPEAIAGVVADLRTRNHASIAVIGRTEPECVELARALADLGLDPELITPKQSSYKGGLSVMPAYLTKGLEFDAVIVAGADQGAYGLTPRDAKLLYVACTRALHELVLLHTGNPSPLLP
jgi:DNA helicase-2/ATP-dependent DNA helicase PcrA